MHETRIGWAHCEEYIERLRGDYRAWDQKPNEWRIHGGETEAMGDHEYKAIMLITPRKPGVTSLALTKAFFEGWMLGRRS